MTTEPEIPEPLMQFDRLIQAATADEIVGFIGRLPEMKDEAGPALYAALRMHIAVVFLRKCMEEQ